MARERVLCAKANDRCSLFFAQPVVTWDQSVLLVGFYKAFFPVKLHADGDADPGNDLPGSDAGFIFPDSDVLDDLIADVVGNPLSV